jgi:hypothetical protein
MDNGENCSVASVSFLPRIDSLLQLYHLLVLQTFVKRCNMIIELIWIAIYKQALPIF